MSSVECAHEVGLQEMLKDTVRTETYMQAMLKNKHLFKDKVGRERAEPESQ